MVGRVKVAAASLLLSPSSVLVVLVLLPPLAVVVPAPAVGAAALAAALGVAAAALPGVVVLVEAVGPWGAAGAVVRFSSSMSMGSSSSWVVVVLRGVSCGIGESVVVSKGGKAIIG